jgi:hypothetical protein
MCVCVYIYIYILLIITLNSIKLFIMDIGSVLWEVETEVLCMIWRMCLSSEGSPWMVGVIEWVVSAPGNLESRSVHIIHSSIPVRRNLLEIWFSVGTNETSYIDIDINIFNPSWFDTRWQQYITHLHTNSTHNTEKGKLGSAGRAPSLRVISWHLPYNWGKSIEKPQNNEQ